MNFKRHSELRGLHATLSASKYHWLRYTDERLYEYVDNLAAARIGTRKHELAALAIELRQKMPDTQQTLNRYVNEAIGHLMTPEQPLFYSKWAFGTADAVGYRDNVLRIFDLKNGKSKSSEEQLLLYAAFFCLEYGVKPTETEFDLRIFQNDEMYLIETDAFEIVQTMERVVEASGLLDEKFPEGA